MKDLALWGEEHGYSHQFNHQFVLLLLYEYLLFSLTT